MRDRLLRETPRSGIRTLEPEISHHFQRFRFASYLTFMVYSVVVDR